MSWWGSGRGRYRQATCNSVYRVQQYRTFLHSTCPRIRCTRFLKGRIKICPWSNGRAAARELSRLLVLPGVHHTQESLRLLQRKLKQQKKLLPYFLICYLHPISSGCFLGKRHVVCKKIRYILELFFLFYSHCRWVGRAGSEPNSRLLVTSTREVLPSFQLGPGSEHSTSAEASESFSSEWPSLTVWEQNKTHKKKMHLGSCLMSTS